MGWGDFLVGAGQALPGAANQVINTYHQTQQLERQKKEDQRSRDVEMLKLMATSTDPGTRSLAVIGMRRMTQPDYKPGPKGMIHELYAKDIHEHPEWADMHKSMGIMDALREVHQEGPGTPAGGSEMDLPPAPAPAPAPAMPGTGGTGGGPPPTPGATYGMPQGSMLTPNNPSTPTPGIPGTDAGADVSPGLAPASSPAPGPVQAAASASAPNPTPGAAAAPPPTPAGGPPPHMPGAAPATGVHPELEAMIREASSGNSIDDTAAAVKHAGSVFGADVLGGLGPRGEVALKDELASGVSKKDAFRAAVSRAAAQDREASINQRHSESIQAGFDKAALKTTASLNLLQEAEKLRRSRPAKARQAPQLNVAEKKLDIERDFLKDEEDIDKKAARLKSTIGTELTKSFATPAQITEKMQEIVDAATAAHATAKRNKEAAHSFLDSLSGAVPKLGGSPTSPKPPSIKPIVQHSPSTGAYRYSLDGGSTWHSGQPPAQ